MPEAGRQGRYGPGRRALAGSALVLLLGLVPEGVQAGADATTVSGHVVHIEGVTSQKSSFGDPMEGPGSLDLSFGTTQFTSNAVSGEYVSQGRRLRFAVDPARFASYEASWAQAFRVSLAREGLAPNTVDCVVQRARVKGAVRGDALKFKTKYRLRCLAQGAFGERQATAMIRFQGRGSLTASPTGPSPGNAGGSVVKSGVPFASSLPGDAGAAGQVDVQVGGFSLELERQRHDYSRQIELPLQDGADADAVP